MSMQEAVSRAGGPLAMSRALNVTYQAIQNFVKDGPPPGRCPDIEELTGVRCEKLRPDLDWVRDSDGLPLLRPPTRMKRGTNAPTPPPT